MIPFSLSGKTAVVTGATGLLGKEHCRALVEAGARVAVIDLREETCREFSLELKGNGLAVPADITQEDSLEQAKCRILEEWGKIDILVNNAAINDMVENRNSTLEESKFENYPLEKWRSVLDVNVTGMFLSCRVFGLQMLQQKKGSIINIASTYGIVAPDQSLYRAPDGSRVLFKSPAYPTSKGAVISFTRFLAAYWGSAGIRVNSLTPGGVKNNQDSYFIQSYSLRTPLGRMAEKDDYRGAIIFLASDTSSYMTGANLVVDGGWTIW